MMLFVLIALDIYFLLTFITLWVNSADNKWCHFSSYDFFQLETIYMRYQIPFSELKIILLIIIVIIIIINISIDRLLKFLPRLLSVN